ncbi:MAG TPA: hypothetical protein VGJ32_10855 [Solirubrobacteraceae bacterium]|jgi:hypothetical protein
MSRVRLALAGAALVAALALSGLSGAAMTGGEREAPSVFTGGTLELSAGEAGAARLDAANMRPGQTRTATFALRNAGSVAAALSASARDRADVPAEAALSAVLELRLEDCGTDATCAAPRTAYSGSLRDFAGAALGDAAAGATRFVRVSLVWGPTKADPSRQGATASATLVWQAVAGSAA